MERKDSIEYENNSVETSRNDKLRPLLVNDEVSK